MSHRLKLIIPLILFAITIGFAFESDLDAAALPFFAMVGFIFYFAVVRKEAVAGDESEAESSLHYSAAAVPPQKEMLVYYGDELNFSDEEITAVLDRHFPYYSKLTSSEKDTFTERVQLFIADKVFKIHCNPGFKEMPVLISAAAIQLTFGLKKYLLPNFRFIHVYPEEFLGVHPTIRVLEGNVSGHAINLSWKHFLEGYKNPRNGQNVGLHELAHALYYQTFVVEENVDHNFRDTFDAFSEYGNKVFEQEKIPGNDLYSDYALRNFQEFWAESIEIFFEKPWQMKKSYPALYTAIASLLNQDPGSSLLPVTEG